MSHPMMTTSAEEVYESDRDQPPHDRGAEQSVLGAMMLSEDAIGVVAESLDVEEFFERRHQAIYQVILDLFNAGQPADPVTVATELGRRGELRKVGEAPYLHTLIATVPTATNVGYYAEIVAEKATLRGLIAAGTRISQYGELAAATSSPDLPVLLERAQEHLDEVLDGHVASTDLTTLGAMRAEALSTLDDLQAGRVEPGLPTGMLDLDAATGGWKPGQLIIIAARPGLGKSTLGVDFARCAAIKHAQPALIFSLEMSRKEIWLRVVSAEAKVRHESLTTPHALTPADMDRITGALNRIDDAPFLVDDTPNMTLTTIRAKARRIKRQQGLGLVVVDYLQLLTAGGRYESRQQEVSELSRQLKLLAKELEVPVIAISQLNRGPEQRADKRPMLSDLRESGSLEQDADIVLLINRPDAWERDDPRAGEADLILAKHRAGPQSTIVVAHQLHYSRFADLAKFGAM
ncbi:replicative DNA helicase [Amycolatopsis minnesotensis]|uniref:Replicative DNA helicase n=1 Tax=Amycolatopsis minnesotensis TaxID=337894 RepID=A0ABP5DRN8_9PSEU